jgi:hypothetical protein
MALVCPPISDWATSGLVAYLSNFQATVQKLSNGYQIKEALFGIPE